MGQIEGAGAEVKTRLEEVEKEEMDEKRRKKVEKTAASGKRTIIRSRNVKEKMECHYISYSWSPEDRSFSNIMFLPSSFTLKCEINEKGESIISRNWLFVIFMFLRGGL